MISFNVISDLTGKRTRAPHDFVNNANTKLDDAGDGDDDDAEDDDHDSNLRGGSKRRPDVKLKQEYGGNTKPMGGNVGLNVDMHEYPLHRPMAIPQPPMSLHSPQLPSPSGASSLPISTERHTTSGRLPPTNNQLGSQKKPRLAPSLSASSHPKVSPEDSVYSSYLPSPTSAHHSNSYRQNGHPLHYNYSGVATSSPQQSFLPSSLEFPSSSRGAPVSRTAGYNPRSSSTYSQHQDSQLQGMYHPLMRHNLPPGQPPNSSSSRSQQSPDLLSAFLENGDDHRPPPTHSSQFSPLDWPSHAPSHESQASPQQQHDSGHSGDTSWLDFLSNSAPQPGGQSLHMALPPASGRDGLSWERDRNMEHYAPSERGGIDKGIVNGTGVSPTSRKRLRTDSIAEDGRRPSPGSRNKLGIGQDTNDLHGPGIKEE